MHKYFLGSLITLMTIANISSAQELEDNAKKSENATDLDKAILEYIKKSTKTDNKKTISEKDTGIFIKNILFSGNKIANIDELKEIINSYQNKILYDTDLTTINEKIYNFYEKKYNKIAQASNFKYDNKTKNLTIEIAESSIKDIIVSEDLEKNNLAQKYINELKAKEDFRLDDYYLCKRKISRIKGMEIESDIALSSETLKSGNYSSIVLAGIKRKYVSNLIINSDGEISGKIGKTDALKENDLLSLNVFSEFPLKDKKGLLLSYDFPIGYNGLGMNIAGGFETNHYHTSKVNKELTKKSNFFGAFLYKAIYFTKDKEIYLSGGLFNEKSSTTNKTKPANDIRDRKITGRISAIFNIEDKYNGTNLGVLSYSKILSRKDNKDTGNQYKNSKVSLDYNRFQRLGESRFFLSTNLKFSKIFGKSILKDETSLGGSDEIGRGFKSEAIRGDKTFGASVEFMYATEHQSPLFNNITPYIFADYGRAKNRGEKHQSILSAGIGVLSYLNNNSQVKFEIAKPIKSNIKENSKNPKGLSYFAEYRIDFSY